MNAGAGVLNRIVGLLAAVALTVFILYASRFWIWSAPWSDDGLFGLSHFPPGGDVVTGWLEEKPFSEFAIVIWGCGAIILLSVLQWIASRIAR